MPGAWAGIGSEDEDTGPPPVPLAACLCAPDYDQEAQGVCRAGGKPRGERGRSMTPKPAALGGDPVSQVVDGVQDEAPLVAGAAPLCGDATFFPEKAEKRIVRLGDDDPEPAKEEASCQLEDTTQRSRWNSGPYGEKKSSSRSLPRRPGDRGGPLAPAPHADSVHDEAPPSFVDTLSSDVVLRLEQIEKKIEWWHEHIDARLDDIIGGDFRHNTVRQKMLAKMYMADRRGCGKAEDSPRDDSDADGPVSSCRPVRVSETSSHRNFFSVAGRSTSKVEDGSLRSSFARGSTWTSDQRSAFATGLIADGDPQTVVRTTSLVYHSEDMPTDSEQTMAQRSAGARNPKPSLVTHPDTEEFVKNTLAHELGHQVSPRRHEIRSSKVSGVSGGSRETRGRRSQTVSLLGAASANRIRDSMRKTMEFQEPTRAMERMVINPHFDHFFAGVIVLNALFIAAQTEYLVRNAMVVDQETVRAFSIVDKVFAAGFFVELMLRLVGLRLDFFKGRDAIWGVFDTSLVALSIVEVSLEIRGFDADVSPGDTTMGKVMRIFRMARVIRVVRVFRFLDDLRCMVLLIIHSMRSLFWLMILLLFILFIFSIFFTQGVADYTAGGGQDARALLSLHYGGLANSALTLFMSITGGVSWIEVVTPLKCISWELAALFHMYVSFCVFSVLNIVTGVVVDSAIQRSAQEKDLQVWKEKQQKDVYISMLMELLKVIDTENTDRITRDMFKGAFQREHVANTLAFLDIDIHDPNELFDMLGEDGGDSVTWEEFVIGCLRLKGKAKSIDIHKLLFEVKHLMRMVDDLFPDDSA